MSPVDPRYLGLWLTGLFGNPDTSDNLDGGSPVGKHDDVALVVDDILERRHLPRAGHR